MASKIVILWFRRSQCGLVNPLLEFLVTVIWAWRIEAPRQFINHLKPALTGLTRSKEAMCTREIQPNETSVSLWEMIKQRTTDRF